MQQSQPLSDDRCIVRDYRLREGEEGLAICVAKCVRISVTSRDNARLSDLVHSLMRMNLTGAQVGCILKYCRVRVVDRRDTPASHSYLSAKTGLLPFRRGHIEQLRKELSLTPSSRFPLTWIMETADDISC